MYFSCTMGVILFVKRILVCLSILLVVSCTSWQEDRYAGYEDIIARYGHSSADTLDAMRLSADRDNAEDLAIVYRVLLAQQIATEADSANLRSEQLLEEANKVAGKIDQPDLEAWVYTQTGFYHYTYYDYLRAMPYFLKASKLLDMSGAGHPVAVGDVYKKNSFFWGTIGEKEKAVEYLKTAIQHTPADHAEYPSLLNNLGFLYADLGQWDLGNSYFEKSGQLAAARGDHENRAKAFGGLAAIEQHRGNPDNAAQLWIEDIRHSELAGAYRNTMFAQLQLGKLYLEQGKADKMLETVLRAQDYVRKRDYLLGFDQEITALLKSYYEMTGNGPLELAMRKKLDSIGEERHSKDSEAITNKVLLETQREKMNWQIEAEKAKLEKAGVYQWTLTVIAGMLIALLVLLLNIGKRNQRIQRDRYEKQILAFELEKVRSEERLYKTDSTLSAYKNYLEEKNRQISSLEQTLAQMNHSSGASAETHKKGISELLESHLLTEENWQAFKQAFIAEEPDFYAHINDTYPDITESQIRIILLKKIGMNNSQMSQLLGITVEGVKKSKQRLRKKHQPLQEFFDTESE